MSGDTRDTGRVRFCSASRAGDERNTTADLLAAIELLLPYATLAPAWAIQAARDAIEQARGGAKS